MTPHIKKILYATDLSKNSSYAFLYATDMARRHNATIVILHAIDPVPPYAEAYAGKTVAMWSSLEPTGRDFWPTHFLGVSRMRYCIELGNRFLSYRCHLKKVPWNGMGFNRSL